MMLQRLTQGVRAVRNKLTPNGQTDEIPDTTATTRWADPIWQADYSEAAERLRMHADRVTSAHPGLAHYLHVGELGVATLATRDGTTPADQPGPATPPRPHYWITPPPIAHTSGTQFTTSNDAIDAMFNPNIANHEGKTAMSWTCSKCRTDNRDNDAARCRSCGHTNPGRNRHNPSTPEHQWQGRVTCPHCGYSNASGADKKCYRCGKPLRK